ncbi:MAG: nucleotidyltransferase domain-containing protein [Methylovulum sp.]|nr:nucleotidyltransferase domain-containing protein [Methylovulum sp.]
MRLSPDQTATIRANAQHYFGEEVGVWLFGSRTDDRKRGGDIDLYIEAVGDALQVLEHELKFYAALQCQLGVQRIDIVVRRHDQPMQIIHTEARRTGIRL